MPSFRVLILLFLAATACDLQVRAPESVRDDQVARAVKNALLDSRRLNLSRIDVSVEEGVCYLSGEASSGESKRDAEKVASGVPGVRQVVNKLEVQP
jgi:osmotically-inducible protein OsmY